MVVAGKEPKAILQAAADMLLFQQEFNQEINFLFLRLLRLGK
jgi:hypothetical protein